MLFHVFRDTRRGRMPASDHGSVVFTLHGSRTTAGIAYGKYRTKREKRVWWCAVWGLILVAKIWLCAVPAFHPQWDS